MRANSRSRLSEDDEDDDKPFWPQWFKILWVSGISVIFVGPMLYVVFGSYFMHKDPNQMLGYFIDSPYFLPIIVIFTIIAWIVIIIGLTAKYRYARKL